MTTVPASVPVLRWAARRAHPDDEDLAVRFRKWPLWLSGEVQPTLKQLEDFANLTHTAIGYFFLPEPPQLALPVPDFRTLRDQALAEPSSALLDTLYLCQQRQDWYRDYARLHGLSALAFVGSARIQDAPEVIAQRMRETLGLSAEERRQLSTWTDALRQLINKTEDAGVLVMASSIVGSNSHRKLDVEEFRGFALADELAPLIFLNGSDSKAAQMFTLAHELAHLWLGATGVSDTEAGQVPEQQTERWCNRVAAELLVPLDALRAAYRPDAPIPDEIQRLAREFKVSTLVALRRLFDAGFIEQGRLWQHYREEQARLKALEQRGSGGGDFYRTLGARTSKRFARAIVSSTLEGQTLFQDAFRMLGVRKTATFYEAARELGGDGMSYLLDANVFIQAKNLHYGLDFCPAFWQWLLDGNANGRVLSIDKVADEIAAGADELTDWVRQNANGLFNKTDSAVAAQFAKVSGWVTSQQYEPAAINTFLQVADFYLVAHALAGGHIVVTHEVAANSVKRIKIPNVCIGLGLCFMTPYEMLRIEKAKFVLGAAQ